MCDKGCGWMVTLNRNSYNTRMISELFPFKFFPRCCYILISPALNPAVARIVHAIVLKHLRISPCLVSIRVRVPTPSPSPPFPTVLKIITFPQQTTSKSFRPPLHTHLPQNVTIFMPVPLPTSVEPRVVPMLLTIAERTFLRHTISLTIGVIRVLRTCVSRLVPLTTANQRRIIVQSSQICLSTIEVR